MRDASTIAAECSTDGIVTTQNVGCLCATRHVATGCGHWRRVATMETGWTVTGAHGNAQWSADTHAARTSLTCAVRFVVTRSCPTTSNAMMELSLRVQILHVDLSMTILSIMIQVVPVI